MAAAPLNAAQRRALIIRNQRNRVRQQHEALRSSQTAAAQALHDDVDDEDDDDDNDEAYDPATRPRGSVLTAKMGAKKIAKLEAKEQKRLMREQELRDREQRKLKEAKEEEERKKQEEREAEEERKRLEAEKKERLERERREQEEYMKLKQAFTVDEEGFGELEGEEKENLLATFIQYIKDAKVVMLEDLAAEFKLKTQQAIERIQELQANGTLTGVIDDRGKFIYISEDELRSVAKFIRQRGRVSITELAENSNRLISLTPLAAN